MSNMQHKFDNLNQLEAQISSLPGAEMRALHPGKTLEQTDSPQERKEDLKEVSDSTRQYAKGIDREPVTNAVGVFNQETGDLATTGTVQYDIVNHREAFQPVVDSLKDLGVHVSGDLRYRDGKNRVLLEAYTGREFDVNGEKYGIGFQIKNTYNKSGAVELRGYFIRQVCSNGMIGTSSMGVKKLKRQHRGEVDIVEEYREWFQNLLEVSSEFRQVLANAMEDLFDKRQAVNVLVNAGIPKTKVLEILGKVEPHSEQPVEIPEGKVSRKQLYDAVTYYVSHELEDVAFTTEERYQRFASNILTWDRDDLLFEIQDDDSPIKEDQETLETVEQAMEVEE